MNPPCVKPTDAQKYRQQYLTNLKLEAANNQKNLNANLLYKQTGQTPSQPTDFRTTTEKEADIDSMRREVRSYIAAQGFTNSTNANEIAQRLSAGELSFVIQYANFITVDFKGRGVPAEVFINYIKRLITKTEQTLGVEMGLQQETGEQILLSNQQILSQMPSKTDLEALKMAVISLRQKQSLHNDRVEFMIGDIQDEIARMNASIPTPEDLARISQLPMSIRADIQRIFNDALADIPTKRDINEEFRQLNMAINANDQRRTEQVLGEIRNLIDIDRSTLLELAQVKILIIKAIAEMTGEAAAGGGEAIAEAEVVSPQRGKKKGEEEAKSQTHITAGEWDGYSHNAKKAFLQKMIREGRLTGNTIGSVNRTKARLEANEVGTPLDINFIHQEYLRQRQMRGGEPMAGATTPKMKGKGLSATRSHLKGNRVEDAHKITKKTVYVPFGRFVINKHRLDDNVVMIHRPSGMSIPEFPTHLVSPNLGHILKAITGGIIPHIDHITGLGIGDQEHLYKMLKHARIDNVPVPSPKTDNQKEMDRFNILKGEIQAGNDNKTLVREFKVILLRFINDGRIPRKQGQDILLDLTSMGF